MNRPLPPEHMHAGLGLFEPAHDVLRWARATIINDDAPLFNPDHEHLGQAKIGFVWTNEPNEKKGRMVLGMCSLMPPTGDKWSAGRATQQIIDWFGEMPDFLIVLYAPEAALMDDASFMALVEHEMYHAAPKTDAYGSPMHSKETGLPLWAIAPHSVEEFTGVVSRYGAWSPALKEMAAAIAAGPEIAPADISFACGSCR